MLNNCLFHILSEHAVTLVLYTVLEGRETLREITQVPITT